MDYNNDAEQQEPLRRSGVRSNTRKYWTPKDRFIHEASKFMRCGPRFFLLVVPTLCIVLMYNLTSRCDNRLVIPGMFLFLLFF